MLVLEAKIKALPEFPWLNAISRVVVMLGSLYSPPG
jgi:hypothetical protein